MAEVLDWLMCDAASSGAGPASEEGSAAGDPDRLGLDSMDPQPGGVLSGAYPRPCAVGIDELDLLLKSEVRPEGTGCRECIPTVSALGRQGVSAQSIMCWRGLLRARREVSEPLCRLATQHCLLTS